MEFNIGDRVLFLNEKGGGIIVQVLSKTTLLVRSEHGFDIPFNINDLLLADSNVIVKKTVKPTKKGKAYPGKKDIPVKRITKKVVVEKEVDLHIEELLDDTTGLSNGEKLEIQLTHFQKELEEAILNKQTRTIVFIHGVGSGRLKQEIYNILKNYDGIRFYDASYRKYGLGATEVVIR